MQNAHSQRAEVAIRKLALFDQAFSSLAIWAHHRDTDGFDTSRVEIDADGELKEKRSKFELAPAYTDGRTIFYGTEFAKWKVEMQMAVVAHEIMHIAFRHVNRGKALAKRLGDKYDPKVFNIATDAIINDTLRLAGYRLPDNCIYLTELFEKVFKEDIKATDAIGEWDSEKLYMRIMNERKAQSGGGGKGKGGKGQSGQGQQQGQGGGQSGDNGDDGKTNAERAKEYAEGKNFHDDMDTSGPLTPEDKQEDSEWQQRVSRAMAQGRQAGTGIGKLGHKIADLPKSNTPWELLLRRLVNKAVTRSPRQSYSNPARRWIGAEDNANRLGLPTPAYEPGFVKMNTQPRVAICVDVSGSIGDVELEIFCAEIASIGRKTGSELHVFVFDTQLLNYQKLDGMNFEKEVKNITFARGGGTSFVEVTQKAQEIDPSIIVFLTDLYGPFGEKPKAPVIWASPDDKPPEPPYGRLLSLAA